MPNASHPRHAIETTSFIEEDAPGLWRQPVHPVDAKGQKLAALFFDRDGVIVEEVNYLHRVEDLRLIPGAAAAISRANARSIPVVMVTNQSGVGRGYYDWPAFAKLQEELLLRLGREDAEVNMVMACGYHKDALSAYQIENHPWRKPNPGMLNAAANDLGLDLSRSWLIGDALSDIDAARNAGLAGAVHVLTGHGARDRAVALTRKAPRFSVRPLDSVLGISALIDELFPVRR
jgi:D-glycero-D-manno-heptose 1,7-bisphosphate phosphatase